MLLPLNGFALISLFGYTWLKPGWNETKWQVDLHDYFLSQSRFKQRIAV
jgi:hypothetical protein